MEFGRRELVCPDDSVETAAEPIIVQTLLEGGYLLVRDKKELGVG